MKKRGNTCDCGSFCCAHVHSISDGEEWEIEVKDLDPVFRLTKACNWGTMCVGLWKMIAEF